MGWFAKGVVILACAGLCACSPLTPREPQRPVSIYTLDQVGKVARVEKPLCHAVTVNAVRSAPGYGSARMAYRRSAHQLEYFAYHKWADSPANMLQTLLVDALEKSGRFGAVLTPAAPERSRVLLNAELLTLRQEFSGDDSRVVLTVRARVFGSDQVISSRIFTIEEAAGSGPETGVTAANRATARLTSELVDWIGQVLSPVPPACR